MARFIAAAGSIVLGRYDGYDVSGALRLPFFSECLNTHNYRHASRWAAFRTALIGMSYQAQMPPAEALLIVEWDHARIVAQHAPLLDTIRQRGIATEKATLRPPQKRDILRALTPRNGAALLRTNLRPSADRIATAFGLEQRPFQRWLWSQAAIAWGMFRTAENALRAMQTRPRAIVMDSEYHPRSRAFAAAAQRLKIPVIVVQHGFLGQGWLHHPLMAKTICVWGEVDQVWYKGQGVVAERIALSGSPRAFTISAEQRRESRERHHIREGEVALVFFAPNLSPAYHERAAGWLRAAAAEGRRWFVRFHPSTTNPASRAAYEGAAEPIPADESFETTCAFADGALHDYSSMQFPEYAGIPTACLPLDPPYPVHYAELLGDQPLLTDEAALWAWISARRPLDIPSAHTTRAMAAGGVESLRRIADAVWEHMKDAPR